MSVSMKEAFLAAGRKNPEKKGIIYDAIRYHKAAEYERYIERQKAKEEAEKKRQLEAAMAEATRRSQEIEVLTSRYPYKYTYRHFGEWSMTFGIVFALTYDDALAMVREEIKRVRDSVIPSERSWFDDDTNLRIRIEQIDLSSGIANLGEYYE